MTKKPTKAAGVDKPSTTGGTTSRKGKRSGKKPPRTSSDPPTTDDGRPLGKDGKPKGLHGVPGSKNPERRCKATANRTGERCKRAAIKGGTVCTTHGGASPQVQKKARERLEELVDPALAVLNKILRDPETDDSIKVRASLGVLDRTGFGPGQYVTVQSTKWDEAFEGGEFEVDRSAPPDIKWNRREPAAPRDDDVVDAEWYTDDDAPAGAEGGAGPIEPTAERYGPRLETREEYLLRMLDDD